MGFRDRPAPGFTHGFAFSSPLTLLACPVGSAGHAIYAAPGERPAGGPQPSIFPSNAPSNGGVNVAFVMPGSAADRSGLRAGDVITTVDGTPTPNISAFTAALNGLRSGAIVQVTIRRNGRFEAIELELD